jgi:hypothetical protein
MDKTLQKEIAKNILQEYIKIENNLTDDYQYYCHTEFDSNVTEFEGLSNSNKIVLKSRLDVKYIPIIMRIFHNIYEKNYWYLSEEGILNKNYIAHKFISKNRVKILSSNIINLDEWLKFLDELASIFNVKMNNNNELIIYESRIYKTIPKIEPSYYPRSKKNQKIYTLQDIVDWINI